MCVRVRFAPSPTGFLHVGGARTALFNWLFARHNKGTFVLRIEDTDVGRSTEDSFTNILAAMRWLGLDWDEGPDVGGPFGPYQQSMRKDLHQEHCEKLIESGHAYPCFCTKEELEAKKQECLAKELLPKYDGACRSLTPDQVEQFKKENRPFCVRFRVEGEGTVVVDDIVRGSVEFDFNQIGDFIIRRSDGGVSFDLANVVDDMTMEITHVVRGEDHLSNTPRHILLYNAFGATPPKFAHLSMILGSDRKRLSKRHGATSVTAMKEQGYLPEALVNFLALLGWSPPDEKELITLEKLIDTFSLERVAKSSAIFDYEKLNHINNHVMRTEPIEKIVQLSVPFFDNVDNVDDERALEPMIELVRARVNTLSELPGQCRAFFEPPSLDSPELKQAIESDEAQKVLSAFAEKLSGIDQLDRNAVNSLGKEIQNETGVKGQSLYTPLRVALTGQLHGPDLVQMIVILGKDESLERTSRCLKTM